MAFAASKKSKADRPLEGAKPASNRHPTLRHALADRAPVPALLAPTVLGDVLAPDPNEARHTLSPRQRIYPDDQASQAEIVSVTIVPAELYGAAPRKTVRNAVHVRPRRSVHGLSTAFSVLAAVGALAVGVAPLLDGAQEPLGRAYAVGRASVHAYVSSKVDTVAGLTGQRSFETPAAQHVVAETGARVPGAAAAVGAVEPRQTVVETSLRAGLVHEPRIMLMSASFAADTPTAQAPRESLQGPAHVPLAAIWTTVTVRDAVATKPTPAPHAAMPAAHAAMPAAHAAMPAAHRAKPALADPKNLADMKKVADTKKVTANTQKAAPIAAPRQGVTSAATTAPAKAPATLVATPQAGPTPRPEASLLSTTSGSARLAANSRRSLGVTQVENPTPRSTPPLRIPSEDSAWTQDVSAPRR
jgi:hypothetical protein